MRNIFLVLACILLFLSSGCGEKVSVTGRVTFSDDGSPVSSGSICFVSGNWMARGEIDENGYYKAGTISKNDGLPKGTYSVYIGGARKQTGTVKTLMIDNNDPSKTIEKDEPIYEELIDPKFCDPVMSGLTIEVNGSTRFDVVVDRKR
ncbi:MAG: carboxypeptidase-like regulatory domain-containing protein [Planctomycetaceae bacterium]|jgi:hypothetical protein|nr:carboxypeptidase-like regulatory domain-containing protein [Planctomycetaceae bacterium]